MALLAVLVLMTVRLLISDSSSLADWVVSKLYILPGILIGVSFHEYAHAKAADMLGDPTPRNQNRLTVNPGAHLEPVGMVALLLVGFGWGQPVQINPRNFKNPRRDHLLVALSGAVMNLLVAIVFTFVLKAHIWKVGVLVTYGTLDYVVRVVITYCIAINLILMIFNLMPLPPLDGYSILTELFHLDKFVWWRRLYQYGFLVLLMFIFLGLGDYTIQPLYSKCLNILLSVAY